jgi:hypothetical protein
MAQARFSRKLLAGCAGVTQVTGLSPTLAVGYPEICAGRMTGAT